MKAIIEVANYYSEKNYVPTFLIEEKYKKEIIEIKKKVKNAYFPESYVSKSIRNPLLVVAIGKKLNSAISIDNGIMHMLGLAGTKTAVFYENNSEKFRPMNDQNIKIYSATHPGNKKIPDLNSNDVLNFIKDFI